jgi:hypothetical protein
MRTSLPIILPLAVAAAILAPATPAAAGDDLALLATGAYLMPRADVGESYGGGAEARLADDNLTVGFGVQALIGRTPALRRRDLMDVHFDVGLLLCERCRSISPYTSIGLDILHVTTHEPGRSVRGSTLGLSGHAGLLGKIGDDGWMWRAGASYLGAIVPGTGEDLGGVTLSVGIGKRIMK